MKSERKDWDGMKVKLAQLDKAMGKMKNIGDFEGLLGRLEHFDREMGKYNGLRDTPRQITNLQAQINQIKELKKEEMEKVKNANELSQKMENAAYDVAQMRREWQQRISPKMYNKIKIFKNS